MSDRAVTTYDEIRRLAGEKTEGKLVRAALVVPSETPSLPAFIRAFDEGLIEPTIIGDRGKLQQTVSQSGFSLDGVRVIDINQTVMAVRTAVKLAEAGEIDVIVQGRLLPEETLSVLTELEAGFVAQGRTLSHVGVLRPGRYDSLLFITDGLCHDEPDLKMKLTLIDNLAGVCERLGVTNPKTAVVTAVEAIYPQMPATLDGAVLAKMSSRGQIKRAVVDGPLSFDIAIDREAAEAKGIVDSPVAGQADALLASTKQVAAGICQAMSLFADCECGNVIVGGRVPVAVNFVSDSESSRYNSILLAILNT
jgi:phosphotransacetylase